MKLSIKINTSGHSPVLLLRLQRRRVKFLGKCWKMKALNGYCCAFIQSRSCSLYHPIFLQGGNVISDIGEQSPAHEAKWTNTFFYVYRWPDALICELMHPHYPGVRERGRERKKWRQLPKLASSPSSWICWTTLKSIHLSVEYCNY